VSRIVPSNDATVVLVLDVSGSMQAIDVKPTRLVAAQRALHTFLDEVPPGLKVGLVLFAG
jgi:Ca-activated chloride channel family protein